MRLYKKATEWFEIKSKFINKLIFWYTLILMVYQAIYLVMPIRYCIYRFHLQPFAYILAITGLIFTSIDLLFTHYWRKNRITFFLLGTIAILTISTIVNYQYHFSQNVKSIIWQTVQMLLLFPLCTRIGKNNAIVLLRRFFWIVCCVYIPGILISIYYYLSSKHYLIVIDGISSRQGFTEGRLFGVFSSPPFISAGIVCLAFLAIYFFQKTTKKLSRVFYIIFAVLFFIYTTAAGARSVQVGITCALSATVFLVVRNKLNEKRVSIKRLVSSLLAVIMIGVCFLSFTLCKTTLEYAKVGYISLTKELERIGYNAHIFLNEDDDNDEYDDLEDGLQRNDVSLSNISNNRFAIWTSYLKIFVSNPVNVFVGMTPNGYMANIIKNHPDSYIVKYIEERYPAFFAKSTIYDTHNDYLSALIMSGAIGFLLLIAFLLYGFASIVKHIKATPMVSSELILGLALLIFILVSSFFDSDLFFRCTSTSVNFWFIAGVTYVLSKSVKE